MPDKSDTIKTDTRDFQWYKRDARAYYEATRRMSLEARGAYADIIDLIYIHGGALPDDPKWMSHALFVSVRKWKALREELIAALKIECEDGEITNPRATLEIEKRATQRRVNRENSVKQSRKAAENPEKPNKINKTDSISIGDTRASLELELEEEEERERKKDIKSDRSILSLEDLVEEIWTASAGRMMDDLDDPTMLLKSWQQAGATDDDIIKTIRAVAAHKPAESIGHFGYFHSSVQEAIADRKAGRTNRHVRDLPETQAEYFARKRAEAGMDLAEGKAHGTA